MARIRSPGYPNASLQEALGFAAKIHAADYTHPISREVAARHMGFSGITGTSDRAISALMHYGLARKAAKGEMQLTQIAVDILHPEDDVGRRRALREAGFSPDLFQELRGKFPGKLPSEESLMSYLVRQSFAQRAIAPAARAYIQTCQYLQQEGAYESDPAAGHVGIKSSADQAVKEDAPMAPEPDRRPPPAPNEPVRMPARLNEVRLQIEGGTASVQASFDKRGLDKLIKKLQSLHILLDDAGEDSDPEPPSQSDDAHFDRSDQPH